jgi:superfamily II DNA or RNA helicase
MDPVVLTVDNRNIRVAGLPNPIAKRVSTLTSYLQAGYEHSKAFQGHWWDGRRRLATMRADGSLQAPVGLAEEIVGILRELGVHFKVEDRRRLPGYRLGLKYQGKALRPYQLDAVRAATEARGELRLKGRGVIKLPPRGGKTLVSAAIVAELDVRALFVVPALTLLDQAQAELQEALQVPVGMIGDQVWAPADITVATVQTLVARRGKNTKREPAAPEYLQLLRNADLVIMDECHHLEAELWRQVMRDAGAAYQLGLSATAFPDHDREQELGVIWLRACTGDLLIDISASDLIELGYLVQPEIRFYPMRMPANLQGRGWSQRLYREAIHANRARNELIARVTCELVAEGWQPAVISNRLEQVGAITRMLDRSRVPFARLTGQTDRTTRKRQIERFRAGELRALVGTVLDEGVDIPELDAVVNAEGGADIKATYQRLRCMTVAPGKTRALVVDFMDLMHPIFADHSLARLRVYQGERAFRVLAAAA